MVPARRRDVEQAVDKHLDARLQHFERARREGRAKEFAYPRVHRRIVEDEACGVVFVQLAVAEIRLEVDCLVGAPGHGIAIDGDKIVVAREKIRAVRHAMHRVVLAQRAVSGIRIVEECRIEPFEIERGGKRAVVRWQRRDSGRRSHRQANSYGIWVGPYCSTTVLASRS